MSALRAISTVIALLVTMVFCVPAYAGFNSPLHWSGPLDHAKDAFEPNRCPKLSNPIECTGDNNHSDHHTPEEDGKASDKDRASGHDAANLRRYQEHEDRHHHDVLRRFHIQECKYLHERYVARHGVSVPISLLALKGCDRWRADNDYHNSHPDSVPGGLFVLAGVLE